MQKKNQQQQENIAHGWRQQRQVINGNYPWGSSDIGLTRQRCTSDVTFWVHVKS